MPSMIVLGQGDAPMLIPPPGDGRIWRAFGIHPSSTIDICKVGGELLSPRSIVYTNDPNPKVETVRGIRQGMTAAQGGREQNTLVLVGFRDCDDIEMPGPRAKYVAPLQTFKFNTDIVTGTFKFVQRIPFSGRRHAVFYMTWKESTAVSCSATYFVRGIRFADKSLTVPENTGVPLWYPTDSAMSSGNTIGVAASVAQPAVGTLTVNAGGYDAEESFDELEFWLRLDTAPTGTPTLLAEAEAFGEHVGP